jgi:cleavage stimulation factor subunit 1
MSLAALDAITALQDVTGLSTVPRPTGPAADKPSGLVLDPAKIEFYHSIIQQLKEDGLVEEARSLQSRLANVPSGSPHAAKGLFEIYQKDSELARSRPSTDGTEWTLLRPRPLPPIGPNEEHLDLRKFKPLARLEEDEEEEEGDDMMATEDVIDRIGALQKKAPPQFKTRYTAQHKQGVRSVAFSADGRLCASGSADTSIKVMDASKMRMFGLISGAARTGIRALGNQPGSAADELRPVIRTFYDHVGTVSCLAFHPRQPVLFSGAADKTIKMFDLTRGGVNKKAMVSISDIAPVNVVCPHPSGDFVLAGTQHPVIRLYDINTQQCYSSYTAERSGVVINQHRAGITDLKYCSDASVFASTSNDGNLLLWDGISNRVINRLVAIHNTQPIFSCQWSRNNRYLMTTGGDHRVRLLDIRTGRQLSVLSPDPKSQNCSSLIASFMSGEEYIAAASSGGEVAILDSLTGSVVLPNLDLHQGPPRCLATSPTDQTLITGGDDFKVRYVELSAVALEGAEEADMDFED